MEENTAFNITIFAINCNIVLSSCFLKDLSWRRNSLNNQILLLKALYKETVRSGNTQNKPKDG
jgi:hypothetical protein